jgi:hypothetical protein
MQVGIHPIAILSRSNRRVEFEFIEIGRQDDRKSPSNLGSGLVALDKSICNLA